jgi:hypothetical protein
MLYRQSATEFSVKGIVLLKVVIGFWHFQQALGADEVFPLHKGIEARPAIAGINQRDEVLQDAVAG